MYHRLQAYISFHCFLGLITHHNQPVSWTSVSWSGHCPVELGPQSGGGQVPPQAVAPSPKSYDSFQHSLKNYHSKITDILILYSCDRIRYLFKQYTSFIYRFYHIIITFHISDDNLIVKVIFLFNIYLVRILWHLHTRYLTFRQLVLSVSNVNNREFSHNSSCTVKQIISFIWLKLAARYY